jgi:micrococcal nuclease
MGTVKNAVVTVLLLFSVFACAPAQDDEGYLVTRVVDGDTIIVNIDGTDERVRLTGIDTPESVHPDSGKNVPYGKTASDFTKEALEGKYVTLELDAQERDRYGRLLAYVYTDGKMFNETLLSEGHAKVATFPPNVRYADTFTELQKDARERGVGLWAVGEPE